MSKRIVIALGGNALGNNPEEQLELVKNTAKAIVDLIKEGHEIMIGHGNGPQVGMINLAMEYASQEGANTPTMPFPECGAMSQGYIGYHLQQAIGNELKRENIDKCGTLINIDGHPLQTFTRENDSLAKLIADIRNLLDEDKDVSSTLTKIREIAVHYAKKGDLIYPHLKVKYDIIGPSQIMWTLDDEIRNELSSLVKQQARDEEWTIRVQNVIQRIDEMIYKEQNILFPICAANFTDEEWMGIYRDSKDYATCLDVVSNKWVVAEEYTNSIPEHQGEVVMPGGHLTIEQLTALLNIIPLEITFVDGDNINRFFNEGEKVFHRPQMAIDREVFSCHPPKIESIVRTIINDFRSGKREKIQIWMEKNDRTMLVTYQAVRDKAGKYIGTAEFVQDMEFAKEHFLEK